MSELGTFLDRLNGVEQDRSELSRLLMRMLLEDKRRGTTPG